MNLNVFLIKGDEHLGDDTRGVPWFTQGAEHTTYERSDTRGGPSDEDEIYYFSCSR